MDDEIQIIGKTLDLWLVTRFETILDRQIVKFEDVEVVENVQPPPEPLNVVVPSVASAL